MDTATLSVIFTGTVGVIGAGVAGFGQFVTLRSEEHKRREARREDLRSVCDDAARAALGFTHADFDVFDWEGLEQWTGIVRATDTAVAEQLARLGVRVGPESEAYLAYESFENALVQMYDMMREYQSRPLRSEILLRECLMECGKQFEALGGSIKGFLRAAARLAGATEQAGKEPS